MLPETRYAKSGETNIAYQVTGSGAVDLVFVMGWASHLDWSRHEPSFARFLRRLASFSRSQIAAWTVVHGLLRDRSA